MDLHPANAGLEAIEPPPAGRALLWWIDSLRLWRRAPLRFALACLVPILLEAVLQTIPLAGMILSKLVVSIVGAGLYVVMDGLARTGRISWSGLLWGLRARNAAAALQLAAILLCLFAFDALVAFAVYGWAGADVVVLGHVAAHKDLMSRTFSLTIILPGLVPATLFGFAAALVVLEGVRPLRAAWISIRWFASRPLAYVVTLAISALVMGSALAWGYGLGLLVAIPWVSAVGYTAYMDVFGRNAGERLASARETA